MLSGVENLTAIILAGGRGTRLRKITHDRYPKPMVPIGLGTEQFPFLEFVLARLKQQGIGRVVLCVGHLGQMVRAHFEDGSKFGINIQYDGAGEADTGARVHSALRGIDDADVIVTCGDVYHAIEVGPFMQSLRDRPDWQVALAATELPAAGAPNMVLAADGGVIAHGAVSGIEGRAVLETGTLAVRRSAFDGQAVDKDYSLTGHLFPALLQTRALGGMIHAAPFFDIGTPEGLSRFSDYAAAGGALPLSKAKI